VDVLTKPTIPSLYSVQVSFVTRAVILAAFIATGVPVPSVLADPPAATAAPAWAQEPPPGPQLSAEEQEALDAKRAGTLKDTQKKALKSAEEKQKTAEMYAGERNKQKQRGGPRRR
jgi:hypothetical protein